MPRIRRLFRFPWRTHQEIDGEIDAEVQFHLDMRTQELVDQGMTPDEARVDQPNTGIHSLGQAGR